MHNQPQSNKSFLLLAAGEGKRLRPLTETIPKPLITLENKYLIQYHLNKLANIGVTQVYVNRAYLRHRFDDFLNANNCYGIKINYLDEPDGALETAGAIVNAFHHCNDDELVVINCDIWTDFDFSSLLNHRFTNHTNSHLILVNNPKHNLSGDFGLMGHQLIDKHEAENNTPSDIDASGKKAIKMLTFSGMGVYHRRFFPEAIMAKQPTERMALKPLLDKACQQEQITAQHYQGKWFDIGTIERLNEAQEYVSRLNLSTK